MDKTTIIVPHLETEERHPDYPTIEENPAFYDKGPLGDRLKLVFGKTGSNPRGRMAQLFNAEHFIILIFSAEYERITDADNIDIFHLMPERGINRINVEKYEQKDDEYETAGQELANIDDFTIYDSHTIYDKSYSQLIDFCQAKDDKRSQYFAMADNCHKFCIDFAKHCNVDYTEINFTGIEGCVYGVVNILQFCQFCIAYHGYRVYMYCSMFLLWSIFATAWWSQIHSYENSFKSQFDSCATGTYFILFSSLITIVFVFFNPRQYKYHYRNQSFLINFCAVLFIAGGICYWFGGFAVTGIIRKTLHPICHQISKGHRGYCSAFAGIWFTECSLIGVTSIIFGVDMLFKILNYSIFRRFFNLGLLCFISLVGFFSYAILSTNLKNIKADAGKTTLGAVAAAYFFMFLISSFYICWTAYKYYAVNVDSDYRWGKRIILDVSCMICTVFFGFMLVCGYWAMTSYNGESIERSVLNETGLSETYLAVYWAGMAFFWIFFLLIVLSDMHIGVPQSVDIRKEWEEVNNENNYNHNNNVLIDEFGEDSLIDELEEDIQMQIQQMQMQIVYE